MCMRVSSADSADVQSNAGNTPCSSPRSSPTAFAVSAVPACPVSIGGGGRIDGGTLVRDVIKRVESTSAAVAASTSSSRPASSSSNGNHDPNSKLSKITVGHVREGRPDYGSIYDRFGSLIAEPDSEELYLPIIPKNPSGHPDIRQPWGEGADEWWEFQVRCAAYDMRYRAAALMGKYWSAGRLAGPCERSETVIHHSYWDNPRHKTIYCMVEDRIKLLTRLIRVRPIGHRRNLDEIVFKRVCGYPGNPVLWPRGDISAWMLMSMLNEFSLDTTNGLYDPGPDHLGIAEAAWREEQSR